MGHYFLDRRYYQWLQGTGTEADMKDVRCETIIRNLEVELTFAGNLGCFISVSGAKLTLNLLVLDFLFILPETEKN